VRIGIDYTAAVRQGAGIGRYCRELVRALARQEDGHEYVLLVAGRLSAPQMAALRAELGDSPHFGLQPLWLSERWLNRLWHRLQIPLPVEAAAGRLDLFHSPDFTLPPVWRARTILTVHDLSFLRVPQYAEPNLRAYLEQAVPRSVRRADLVLADSQNTKDDVVELLHVPAERVWVVPAGVEPRFHRVADATELARVQQAYGLTRPFILSVGTLQPRKNFTGLIEAYHLLRAQHHVPHQLVIVGGKGWLYEPILRRVAELGLQEEVRFLGFAADADLPALYSLADLFAWPSFYEGFGIPVLEAMACGTPVVASNVSSLPEVVGDAGLMVTPGDGEALADALRRLLTDATLRADLIARGHAQAARFTWERAAQLLLQAYQQAAATSPDLHSGR